MRRRQKLRRRVQVRVFRCQECGGVNYATKARGLPTEAGHRKDMWCWRCRAVTAHLQIDSK